jgi:hypothetical protein
MMSEVRATPWKSLIHRFHDQEVVAFSVAHKIEKEFFKLGEFLNHLFLEFEKVVFGPSKVQKIPFKDLAQVAFCKTQKAKNDLSRPVDLFST